MTTVPTAPELGEAVEMSGGFPTWKKLVADKPPTVTLTSARPVGAVLGTEMMILVLVQVLAVDADVEPNATVLVPCDEPKFVPLMVMDVPEGPYCGETLVMVGAV